MEVRLYSLKFKYHHQIKSQDNILYNVERRLHNTTTTVKGWGSIDRLCMGTVRSQLVFDRVTWKKKNHLLVALLFQIVLFYSCLHEVSLFYSCLHGVGVVVVVVVVVVVFVVVGVGVDVGVGVGNGDGVPDHV